MTIFFSKVYVINRHELAFSGDFQKEVHIMQECPLSNPNDGSHITPMGHIIPIPNQPVVALSP